jgi:hypothetical protein
MDDMMGQITSVGSNQFTMSFVEGMSSMTISADANTTFLGFDAIGKSNSFSGLAQGQIVMARMQLLSDLLAVPFFLSLHLRALAKQLRSRPRFQVGSPQIRSWPRRCPFLR